jgi:glycosyltransferase involved in cell wall biosynthesis
VEAQGDPGVEVVVVDDGSTDATPSLVKSFDGRLRLRLFHRDHAGNWAANANYGLARATADHVCLLHQDDFWLPGRLGVLKRLVAGAPGAALFLHPSWFVRPDGRRAVLWHCSLPGGRPLPPKYVVERLLVQNFIAAPAPLFRRSTALAVGGLNPALWYAADWDFWLKLAAAGTTVYCARPLTAFRVHPLSQLVVRGGRVEEVRRQLESVLESHAAAWPGPCPVNPAVLGAAYFSLELNVRLLAWYHNRRPAWLDLVGQFVRLGPANWRRFFCDSRVVERVLARVLAGILIRRPALAQGPGPANGAAEKPPPGGTCNGTGAP